MSIVLILMKIRIFINFLLKNKLNCIQFLREKQFFLNTTIFYFFRKKNFVKEKKSNINFFYKNNFFLCTTEAANQYFKKQETREVLKKLLNTFICLFCLPRFFVDINALQHELRNTIIKYINKKFVSFEISEGKEKEN